MHGQKQMCPLWSQDSKIGYLKKKLVECTGFQCVDTNSGKLKVTLIIFGQLWSKMGDLLGQETLECLLHADSDQIILV